MSFAHGDSERFTQVAQSPVRRLRAFLLGEGDRYLDPDAVFGVKTSLITPFERRVPGVAPEGSRVRAPCYTLRYDFTLTSAR